MVCGTIKARGSAGLLKFDALEAEMVFVDNGRLEQI